MKTFVFILLALIAYLAIDRTKRAGTPDLREPERAPPPPLARATPTPRPLPIIVVNGASAIAVRGVVLVQTRYGALVDCNAHSPDYARKEMQMARSASLPPTAGNAAGAALANSAVGVLNAEDASYFGPLQMLVDGAFYPAKFNPPNQAWGEVYVEGVHAAAGAPVHVLAGQVGRADDGAPLLTAGVKLAAGAWMWDASRNQGNGHP